MSSSLSKVSSARRGGQVHCVPSVWVPKTPSVGMGRLHGSFAGRSPAVPPVNPCPTPCPSLWSASTRAPDPARLHRSSPLRSESVKFGKTTCRDASRPRRELRIHAISGKSQSPQPGAFGEFPPKHWRLSRSRRPESNLRAFCCPETGSRLWNSVEGALSGPGRRDQPSPGRAESSEG